jgi:hypothetical protein
MGETPPPETAGGTPDELPTTFIKMVRRGPAVRTRATPSCKKPTIVTFPLVQLVPHGLNMGTVTTESLLLILFWPCKLGSGLLLPPSIEMGDPGGQFGLGALLQNWSCPMLRPRLFA